MKALAAPPPPLPCFDSLFVGCFAGVTLLRNVCSKSLCWTRTKLLETFSISLFHVASTLRSSRRKVAFLHSKRKMSSRINAAMHSNTARTSCEASLRFYLETKAFVNGSMVQRFMESNWHSALRT